MTAVCMEKFARRYNNYIVLRPALAGDFHDLPRKKILKIQNECKKSIKYMHRKRMLGVSYRAFPIAYIQCIDTSIAKF